MFVIAVPFLLSVLCTRCSVCSLLVCPGLADLSVGRGVPGLAAAVVAVVGAQRRVLQRAVGAAGGGAAAAVGVAQALAVLLVDLGDEGEGRNTGGATPGGAPGGWR